MGRRLDDAFSWARDSYGNGLGKCVPSDDDYLSLRLFDQFAIFADSRVELDGSDEAIGGEGNLADILDIEFQVGAEVAATFSEKAEGVGVAIQRAPGYVVLFGDGLGLCQWMNSNSMAGRSGWRQILQLR